MNARRSLSIAVAIAFAVAVPLAHAEEIALEGDPFQGRTLFADKMCIRCHSVWGNGGVLGPEISTAVAGKSWLDLVGDFWNHTPQMIDAMVDEGHGWPALDKGEMKDLLSYLYYLRLFDEPGDAGRGVIAFTRLRCADCHTVGQEDESLGGRLDQYSTYPSAVMLVEGMWNAGPAMRESQIGTGTPIPSFTGKEMADIQAYLRMQGLRENREVKLLPLPDPDRGRTVFEEKRCVGCHHSGGEGPELARSALKMTLSEIGGVLWNHSYAMQGRMRSRGISFPRFEGTEMGDLLAYLYFLGFVGEAGDASRGSLTFWKKGCASCHEGPERGAPDLSMSRAAADPVILSTAMWNHAPDMHELMAEQSMAWPKFDPGDMADLAAYLQQVSASGASPEPD